MTGKKKTIDFDLFDVSSGVNTTDPANSIGDHQVQKSINNIILKNGWKRVPGFTGIKSSVPVGSFLWKFYIYEQFDGTEIYLAVCGSKLYSINISTGAFTELYDMTASQMAYFVTAHNKAFVCNGNEVVKVEDANTAYQVGITAPSGVTAQAKAGGSLADGDYIVYASYARSTDLYSQGQLVGTITLGSGDNTIEVTSFPNSSDGQVDDKVIWATDAGGSVYYFYYHTDDNTTTSFDIANTLQRDTSKVYSTLALLNYRPVDFDFLHVHNNTMIGFKDSTAYWSKKMANAFDAEKFNTQATGRVYTFPYSVKGAFTLGPHLYVNTVGGIIRVPDGDFLSRHDLIGEGNYFIYPNTIQVYGNVAYGYTQKGFSAFDGERFLHVNDMFFDLTKDIKEEMDNMVLGQDSTFQPIGYITKRDSRTEYHLSYRDLSVGNNINNKHWVLNLDKLAIYKSDSYKIPWEEWEGGVSSIVQNNNGNIYYSQSKALESVIYAEDQSDKHDQYVFNKSGVFLSDATTKKAELDTRVIIPDISANMILMQVHVMSLNRKQYIIKIYMDKEGRPNFSKTLDSSTTGIVTFPIVMPMVVPGTSPKIQKFGLPRKLNGKAFYVHFEQNENDTDFEMQRLVLYAIYKKTRYT